MVHPNIVIHWSVYDGTEMTNNEVPSWAIHRRLYDWLLRFATTSVAPVVLFFVALIEAFLPFVPPDALLIPMCLGNRKKSAFFAVISIVGSVLGALVGYFMIASFVAGGAEWIFGADAITAMVEEFDQRGSAYVFIAALTPIPFFVLTTAAGVAKLNFAMFLLACVVGRSLRYGMEAWIVWWIGQPAKQFIEKWFNTITIIACAIIVLGWYISTQLAANG
jgi:membrane protein YqaA with SNARE-associated domain